jgi:hypothetical protein
MARSAPSAGRGARARPRATRIAIAAVRDIKRALIGDSDIAGDVAFQNDVNALLAAVSRLASASNPLPSLPGPAAAADVLVDLPPRARSSTRR